MLEFIKMFGLGILYTILFPFIVAIFVLYLVYVIGNYLVLEAINFCGFFFGYTFTTETELEKKLAEMKEMQKESKEVANNAEVFFAQNNVAVEVKGSDDHE